MFHFSFVNFILYNGSYSQWKVSNEQQSQKFENLEYDPIKISGDISCDNFSDPDLHFFSTNIQDLNTPHTLPEEHQNFLGDDKDENIFCFTP